jgi:hypothetical protein
MVYLLSVVCLWYLPFIRRSDGKKQSFASIVSKKSGFHAAGVAGKQIFAFEKSFHAYAAHLRRRACLHTTLQFIGPNVLLRLSDRLSPEFAVSSQYFVDNNSADVRSFDTLRSTK